MSAPRSMVALLKRIGYNIICLAFSCALMLVVSASADQTPDYVTWLLTVAREEIGYTETSGGYTKYAEWAGDPGAQWCAEFLCWCVDQVDQAHGTQLLNQVFPLYTGSNTGRMWFIRQGRYISRTGRIDDYGVQWLYGQDSPLEKNAYIPEPGDYVFFTFTANKDTDHVALVESVSEQDGAAIIHVIEGNNPDCVQRAEYPLSDWRILGYGTVRMRAGTTLRTGCEGEWVRALQNDLVLLGYLDAGGADGAFGRNTAAAVRAFQKAEALDASGIADMDTQRKLSDAVERFYDALPDAYLVIED